MNNELYLLPSWFDKRSNISLTSDIQRELIAWTSDVVRKFGEVPFGYTEWTLSGHLAMAADRVGFFALQDYFSEPPKPKGKAMPRKRLRPDLYIRRKDGGDECVFEIKSRNIGIGQLTYLGRVNSALVDAWNKVTSYAKDEAPLCCALVGLPVFAHVSDWSEKCDTWNKYYSSCRELYDVLKEYVIDCRSRGEVDSPKPNWHWGYVLRHKYAIREKETAAKRGYDPVAVGMLWVGTIARSP